MDNDMLSQEEIDLLLQGSEDTDDHYDSNDIITDMEKDTLGEIGNISMGTAATTLSTLLNKKVTITTPQVTITDSDKLSYEYPIPFVAVDVRYRSGLRGSNILIVNIDDVKIIADIMMGKDEPDTDRDLTDMDLSAISEVMNQMMGSASTSLSEIFMKKIEIEPPEALKITLSEGRKIMDVLMGNDPIIKISFRMVVEDLIDSQLMQLIPLSFARDMVESLHEKPIESEDEVNNLPLDGDNNYMHMDDVQGDSVSGNNSAIAEDRVHEGEHVIVKNPEFETFDIAEVASFNEPIDLVGEIPIELTVELGRTTKRIEEILSYGPGTIVELDKLLGEPLNVYANGKYIAKGEVVVIDDNFGIRITDIDQP
ncbi:MAG: flagellar motor switch phosphatase FliY [Tissierellia bacterium]|nr:flagellar motor switch phosphatase FliY [Tissierellia bacterium]